MNFVEFLSQEIKFIPKCLRDRFVKKEAEESKRPRDLRPLLTPVPGDSGSYITHPLHMALVNKERQLITSLMSCRDYFNEAIRYYATNGSTVSHHVGTEWNFTMDVDTFRLLLVCECVMNKDIEVIPGIYNGIRVANMYGRVAGWGKLRIVRCRLPKGEEAEKECYMVVGDKNWQRTPQYISMLILLIRICMIHEVPEWINDTYSLQGYWHELIFQNTNRTTDSDIDSFLKNSYEYLVTIMANDEEIFPHDMAGGYSASLGGFHLGSGLNSLVNNDGTHPESTKKLKQLMEELNNAGEKNHNRN